MSGTPPIVKIEHVDEHMARVYISFTIHARHVDSTTHPMVAIATVGSTTPIRLTRERTAVEDGLQ
jgi:hypothetical protein